MYPNLPNVILDSKKNEASQQSGKSAYKISYNIFFNGFFLNIFQIFVI